MRNGPGFGRSASTTRNNLPPEKQQARFTRSLLEFMEWEAPAIMLDARPFGEGDAIVTLMTETQGLHRGLVRGGNSRAGAPVWQPGNLLLVRWAGRLSEQLGSFTGELVHAGAAMAMDDALALAMLSSVCAVAEGALPEREPQPRVFRLLLDLVPRMPLGAVMLPDIVRWEAALLSDLGYGLDLASCAVTGETTGLAFVSPRTGRAVTGAASAAWKHRLLPMPGFLAGGNVSGPADWRDGLRLTGHFLERDAFGHHHRALPQARRMLYDRVSALAAESHATERLGDTECPTI